MMITILKDEPEHDRQTVQLSLDIESYGRQTELVLAHMGKQYVNLARMKEIPYRDENGVAEEREHIALTEAEMDVLVEAWTSFKAALAANDQARAERIAAQVAEAKALVNSVKTYVP